MHIAQIQLRNWRNFRFVDVPLQTRTFIVGPNASGKSNFLDAFRFLRDIADPEGGLQRAVGTRMGVSQIRSLYARAHPNVAIEVAADLDDGQLWRYRLEFTQNNQRVPIVEKETVSHGDRQLLERPDEKDGEDTSRRTQTHLEQVNANKDFRKLAQLFTQIRYLHLVPQIVRDPERSLGLKRSPAARRDPYGADFLEQLALTPKKMRDARLERIRRALRVAVPQLEKLELQPDHMGAPHLRALSKHWRPKAGWQQEDQLSDGTLRLLGLLWAALDGSAPLLLEEPELSLHAAVVREVPGIMARVSRRGGRQVLLSTHSFDLLMDPGIAPEEVLVLEPAAEGTRAHVAAEDEQIRLLVEGGTPMGEAVLPRTAPLGVDQLGAFAR